MQKTQTFSYRGGVNSAEKICLFDALMHAALHKIWIFGVDATRSNPLTDYPTLPLPTWWEVVKDTPLPPRVFVHSYFDYVLCKMREKKIHIDGIQFFPHRPLLQLSYQIIPPNISWIKDSGVTCKNQID